MVVVMKSSIFWDVTLCEFAASMSRKEEEATLQKTASDAGSNCERCNKQSGNEWNWLQPLSPFPWITDYFFSAPTQKMNAPSPETLINIDQNTRPQNPEDSNFCNQCFKISLGKTVKLAEKNAYLSADCWRQNYQILFYFRSRIEPWPPCWRPPCLWQSWQP
jgi:hypothetical protein